MFLCNVEFPCSKAVDEMTLASHTCCNFQLTPSCNSSNFVPVPSELPLFHLFRRCRVLLCDCMGEHPCAWLHPHLSHIVKRLPRLTGRPKVFAAVGASSPKISSRPWNRSHGRLNIRAELLKPLRPMPPPHSMQLPPKVLQAISVAPLATSNLSQQ